MSLKDLKAAKSLAKKIHQCASKDTGCDQCADAAATTVEQIGAGILLCERYARALLEIAEHGEGGGTDKFLAKMARRALAERE